MKVFDKIYEHIQEVDDMRNKLKKDHGDKLNIVFQKLEGIEFNENKVKQNLKKLFQFSSGFNDQIMEYGK